MDSAVMLSHRGEDMNDKAGWLEACPTAMNSTPDSHKIRDKGYVACETVEFCNDERGAILPAKFYGFSEGGAIIALATLDFDDLPDRRPLAAVEVCSHGSTLGVEAQAAHSLAYG